MCIELDTNPKLACALLVLCMVLCRLLPGPAMAAQQDEQVHITYAIIFPSRQDLALVRKFNQENQDIHVNTIVVDAVKTGDIFDNYLHYIKKDPSVVDVFLVDIIRPAEYALLDLAFPLDSFIPTSVRSEFPVELLKACTAADSLYAIPYFVHSGLLYYRKDLLYQEGLTVPTTMRELVEQASLLSKKYGLEGYLFEVAKYEGLICTVLEFMWGCGGGIGVREDGTLSINTPENRQALELLLEVIYDSGIVSDPDLLLTSTELQVEEMFVAGKAAFARHWPPLFKSCQRYGSPVRDKVGVTILPAGPAGISRATLGGWALAINRYSKHPEASWRFIEYLISERVQRARFLTQGDPPARLSDEFETEMFAEDFHLSKIRHMMTNLGSRPAVPFYRVISLILQTYFYDAVTRDMDVEDALRNMELEVNEFIRNVEVNVDIREVMELVRKKPDDAELLDFHKTFLGAYSDFLKATLSYDDLQLELFRFLVEKKKYDTANTCRKILDRRREENMITVALEHPVHVLDPHYARTDQELLPLIHLFEGLCELGTDDKAAPVLAENWESFEDDTRWTFSLRGGVSFHDGTPLDAKTVCVNLERIVRIIENDHGVRNGLEALYLPLEEVEALDALTVEIRTTRPTPCLPELLAHPSIRMASLRNVEHWDSVGKHMAGLDLEAEAAQAFVPAGTGPFSFVKLSEEGRLLLKRSESFRNQKPDVEYLRFTAIGSPISRMLHLKHGNVDVIHPVNMQMISALESHKNTELLRSGPVGTAYLAMNSGQVPLDTRETRAAVARSLDRDIMATSVLQELVTVAGAMLPPATHGNHTADFMQPDLDKAVEHIRTLSPGIERLLLLRVVDTPQMMLSELATAIQEQVTACGLEVMVERVSRARLAEVLDDDQTGQVASMVLVESRPYVSEAGFFMQNAFAPGSSLLFGGLDFDSLHRLSRAAVPSGSSQRGAVYREIQRNLADDLQVLPLVNTVRLYGKRIEVKGERILPNGLLYLGNVSLKRRLR